LPGICGDFTTDYDYYADAYWHQIGSNYKELPVNTARATTVRSYTKDGNMRYHNKRDPVYVPNSKGGPHADPEVAGQPAVWYSDGEMVQRAYTLRRDDDDWGQAATMVRDVLDDAGRKRLVDNIVGHLLNGVSEPILVRAFEYWRNVDESLGDEVENGVRAKQDDRDPKAADQTNPARQSAQDKARAHWTRVRDGFSYQLIITSMPNVRVPMQSFTAYPSGRVR
jgi:catalase